MAEQPSDRLDLGAMARDLNKRVQDLVERLASPPTETAGLSAIPAQFRSVVESLGALSTAPARQMQVIADAVTQQRAQIKTLQQQLQLFDGQLALLESTIAPALEVGEQWTKAQQSMLGFMRGRGEA